MPIAGVVQSAGIEVAGTEISQELYAKLSDVRVESSFGAAGWFQLRFTSEDPLDSKFAIGQDVAITFDDENGTAVELFTGSIDSLAVDHDRMRRHLLVSGYDARRKLGSEPVVRAFAEQTYADILNKIAGEAGLRTSIEGMPNVTFKHVMQNTSNTEFVGDITRRLGLDWTVDGSTLVVRPREAGASTTLRFGEDLQSFSARYTSTEHPKTVNVRGWDPATKRAIVAASETSSYAAPVGEVQVESSSRRTSAGSRTATSWARPVVSADDGEGLATGHARRMSGGDLVGRGETIGNPAIVPGAMCEIAGIDENWNGTYYVTSAEHIYRHGHRYITRFTVGGYDSSSLLDLMGPARSPAGLGFGSGVTIGVVTNNRNTDGPDQGTVKLKFPYLSDDVESGWARVATIGAGKDRGIMFMPEVNDEVLVAFEHGDVNRPYVIGGVWNGKDLPPLPRSDDSAAMKQRQIASLLGHTLTFVDGDDDATRNVAIELADGSTKVYVGQDKIEIIANDGKPIEVKNDKARVVFTGGGDLQLEAENITVSAKKKLKLEGNEIETSSKTNTKIAAGAKLDVTASAPAKVESSAILELKGAMVKVN